MDNQDIIDESTNTFRSERDNLAKELMSELWAKLPFGHTFKLSNGGEATITGINGNPAASKPKISPNGSMRIMMDFQLTGCSQDHVEVTMEITGGGGFVSE